MSPRGPFTPEAASQWLPRHIRASRSRRAGESRACRPARTARAAVERRRPALQFGSIEFSPARRKRQSRAQHGGTTRHLRETAAGGAPHRSHYPPAESGPGQGRLRHLAISSRHPQLVAAMATCSTTSDGVRLCGPSSRRRLFRHPAGHRLGRGRLLKFGPAIARARAPPTAQLRTT